MNLAEALEELSRRDTEPGLAARRAHGACRGLGDLQVSGQPHDTAAAKCSLTGLPHPLCPDMPLVQVHGHPFWVSTLPTSAVKNDRIRGCQYTADKIRPWLL